MHGRRWAQLTIGTAGVLTAMAAALPTAAASVIPGVAAKAGRTVAAPFSPATAGSWRVDAQLPLDTGVPPQEFSPGYTFNDVEAVGPADAWAVGANGENIGPWGSPAIEQWHAGTWVTPKLPGWLNGSKVGGWINQLEAVGGSSPTDVWAVGSYDLDTETLNRAVHWNGTSWTKATLPTPGSIAPLITSIQSLSPANAWAFGCYCEASQSPYIAHYTGGTWHDVTPRALPFGGIWTATAVSPSDIWAVMGDANQQSFVVLHWTGSAWTLATVPSRLTSGTGQFFPGGGIVASKTGGVWFTGSLVQGAKPAVVHDLGGHWSVTQVPAGSPLGALVSDGNGGLWAASESEGSSIPAELWHYTSGSWTQASLPSGESGWYHITWMTAIPGSQTALAVGGDTQNELLLSTP